MLPDSIKHIVFDLGGVIINLSIQRTIDALTHLTNQSPSFITQAYLNQSFFFAYERGEISSMEFRNQIRSLFAIDVTDDDIDQAWNAMILDLPVERLRMLQNLRKEYSISLLSNTNTIHLDYVNEVALRGVSNELDYYFDKAYYSHRVGMRKPDAVIYEYVISDSGFEPHETLFLDDNKDNVRAASQLGIHTQLINDPEEVMRLFAAFN